MALGALHAGLSGVYAYPGTPSTEITEFIQAHPLAVERNVHRDWTCNEKTAMEGALGMSYAGKRAMVCFKHVGLNVAADPFMGSAMTGANGGLVIASCDDPSMHSSQNEQDSRFYGAFAMMPVFEPSSQQETYEMAREAFDYSERRGIPVLMRLTTRLSHSRAVVESGADIREQNPLKYPTNPRQWVTLPVNARVRNRQLIKDYAAFEEDAEQSRFNFLKEGPDKSLGIIACGLAYNYLMENFPDGCPYPVLKVSQYPFPRKLALKLTEMTGTILVLEEGQPLVEERLKGVFPSGITVHGRLDNSVNRDGELTPDAVRAALGLPALPEHPSSNLVMPRPPALCQGCGHRDFYTALNQVLKDYEGARVFGDIGCYTLGFNMGAIQTTVCMGASITMAKGASEVGIFPAVAVIGDGTFGHSGLTGLLDCVNEKANVVVMILDNDITAMTGGQPSSANNKIRQICEGLGVAPEHIRDIVPLPKNHEENVRVIEEEVNYNGVSVIIPHRTCLVELKKHLKK